MFGFPLACCSNTSSCNNTGMGAYNLPSIGAIPPVWLLTSEAVGKLPTGRYYGSDCVRSPIFKYRGPGDPPFDGP